MDTFNRIVDLGLPGVVVGSDGRIRFTAVERPKIGRLFAKAGVNIDSIRTVEAYFRARQQSQCYFDDWLQAEIAMQPMSAERRALLYIISDVAPDDSSDRPRLCD